MTHFIRQGNFYAVTPNAAVDIEDRLPVGTYTVHLDERSGIYSLKIVDGFTVPKKLYGDSHDHAMRILRTFGDRGKQTGVLLSGEQGSGKTLLAKLISSYAAKAGIPTILISEPHQGEGFNAFMQSIEQPTVVFFDEFEKVYDSEEQERLLTLFDGVYPSEKLFLLTCNDRYRIDKHMRNRPGRIYYRIEYTGLDADFIREYCEDNLKNKGHIEKLIRLAVAFGSFNFDMLQAVVEEMNRYGESPQKVMEYLNTKPEYSDSHIYDAVLTFNGERVKDVKQWAGNPLVGKVVFQYYEKQKKGEPKNPFLADPDDDIVMVQFGTDHLVGIDPATGEITFKRDGMEVKLNKQVKSSVNWEAF